MSCIFLGRQIAKRVSNHCQPWPFLWKIGQHAWHLLLECVGVHEFQCTFMCVHMSVLHLCNQNATVITFHFSRKKEGVYKNLFAKGHTRQSNTLLFHFHFVPPCFSPTLLSLPSTTTISQPRLSSSRAFLIRQTQPVLLSKAATASSYQPVTSYLSFRFLSRERRQSSSGITALWILSH